MNPLVHLSVLRHPGIAWLHIVGELDVSNECLLGTEVGEAFAPEDFLVLDARGVTFCDVAGVERLTEVLEDWRRHGDAACCLLSPCVERMARLIPEERLLGRMEDAGLLAHVASAAIAGWEPPLAEWEALAAATASSLRPGEAPALVGLAAVVAQGL
jgi:anti-anti-sigma regulatory factor